MQGRGAIPKSSSWETILGVTRVIVNPSEISLRTGIPEQTAGKIKTLLLPRTETELREILIYAQKNSAPLYTAEHFKTGNVPTSLKPDAAAISLSALEKRIYIKENSLTVEITGGITISELNERLAREGLALMHTLPPAPTDIIVERLALVLAQGANRFADGVCDLLVAARGILPSGEIFGGVKTPRSAAGPDLDSLFFATGNIFGIITGASLRLKKTPDFNSILRAKFKTADLALDALRSFFQRGATCEDAAVTANGKEAQLLMDISHSSRELSTAVKNFMEKRIKESGGKILPKKEKFEWEGGSETGDSRGLWACGRWSEIYRFLRELRGSELSLRVAIKSPAIEGALVWAPTDEGEKDGKSIFELAATCGLQIIYPKTLSPEKTYLLPINETIYAPLKHKLDPKNILNPEVEI